MEGGMPSMVDNVGAGDSQVEEGLGAGGLEVEVRNVLSERQLMEKLEKSEAGRKKLRQAIVLLKEKLDSTSNALELNEALRQEVEKVRLNVGMERERAEAERVLRERVEKENLTIKEQVIGVLQRLDALECRYKADQSEFWRIRSEVKEAVGGIGAALQAVEATKSLYQSLERSLHVKINGAVQSSSKALAIAQSGQSTTSRAQAAALASRSLAKAVQKEVHLVSSQVVTLQKQASNLMALEASLQQESQLRGPGTPINSPDSGEANVSLAVSKEKVSIDAGSPSRSAVPPQVTILTKNQAEAQESSHAKDVSGEGDVLHMLVAASEKPRSHPAGSTIGLPPRGGMFLSRNQLPDEGLKPQTTILHIRPGVKSPRKGLLEVVSRDEHTPNGFLGQPVSSSMKKGPVAIITGVDSILSPAVRVPALLDSGMMSLPSARANGLQKQSEVQPQRFPDTSKGLGSREFSNLRRVVKRGQGAVNGKHNIFTSVLPAQNEACNNHVEADDTFSEGMPQSDYPSSTTKLLKSIMKIFEKEGKNRKSMKEKLMKLQRALESHSGPVQVAQTGTKRKREPKKGKGDGGSEEKGKKGYCSGKEPMRKVSDFGLGDGVTSLSQRPCNLEDKCISQEKEAHQKNTQASGDGLPAQDRLSEMISNLQGRCKGEGLFETTVDCQENTPVSGTDECKDFSDVDICNGDVSQEGTGTNTDLESTDDDLGEDWWAKKVLLSPISSNDLTS
ncbi:hypothetical protein KC19_VG301500 [Ceratodon purpureus]|uniref:Uncharacterized protein n=1 Tax=Ceratodon purpureus TaxID=3225 RepID=A0A8T0HVP1_CERPU|nr:hypothetical protein KC19_VG301500 [Ceratodon purpureus]